MTLPIKFANYAFSTLAVGCDASATSLSVPAGHGARFPALAAGEYFYATLENAALDREIVKVTARVDDALTVLRAQDSTTARSWNAGDSLSLRVNAAAFADVSKAENHEYTPAGTGAVTTTVQAKLREFVSVKDFGAVGDGVTDDTVAFAAAYAVAGGTLFIPDGIYKGNFVFDRGIAVRGAGKRATTLIPNSSASPVVTVSGDTATGLHLEAGVFDLTIDCQSTAATGLVVGSTSVSSGFSNGTVQRVNIKNGTGTGWDIRAATNCTFNQIYVQGFDTGISVTAERNVQVNTYTNCRFRSNRIGGDIRSGNRETYISCNWESNTEIGLRLLRGLSSGPSHSVFLTCWLENNGPATGLSTDYASLILDINSAAAGAAPHNILFQDCNITSNAGAYDVRAVRADLVEFNRCSFTDVSDGGFSASKFSFSSANPRVKMVNCGSLNQRPTPTLYASFPALTADSNGLLTLGFEYLFEFEGQEYTNRKWLTFTPSVIGTTTAGIGTYTNQQGRYRRVGNIVHFSIRLDWTAHTGTGNMDISGLPFASSSSAILSTCAVYYSSITLSASSILMARLGSNSTTISLRQMVSGGGAGADTVPMDTAGSMILAGFYEV